MSITKTPARHPGPARPRRGLVDQSFSTTAAPSRCPGSRAQFQALLDAKTGSTRSNRSRGTFPIDAAELRQGRGRQWSAGSCATSTLHIVDQTELIDGVRMIVGDKVLDTSIRARLEQKNTPQHSSPEQHRTASPDDDYQTLNLPARTAHRAPMQLEIHWKLQADPEPHPAAHRLSRSIRDSEGHRRLQPVTDSICRASTASPRRCRARCSRFPTSPDGSPSLQPDAQPRAPTRSAPRGSWATASTSPRATRSRAPAAHPPSTDRRRAEASRRRIGTTIDGRVPSTKGCGARSRKSPRA